MALLNRRVIPVLLLRNGGLVKTRKFKKASYIGDPINAVRIFNEKEVDELILLDIDATRQRREPNYELIEEIVGEAFIPISYGGGITSVCQAQQLVRLGVEKVIINSAALDDYNLISKISDCLGVSSTVVAVDIKCDWFGRYRVYSHARIASLPLAFLDHIKAAVLAGAGELFINDVSRDGLGCGYDLNLISLASREVVVPVTICGGAGCLNDFRAAALAGAAGIAAGSIFVYVGKHRAVMINYPGYEKLQSVIDIE